MRGLRLTFAFALGSAACLPNPQSVDEARAGFDRARLQGSVIVDAPPDLHPIGARFDDRLELIGYQLAPEGPRPGDTVEVTLYWRALRGVAEDYQVFIHGDPVGGNAPRLHADHFPAQGAYPTWAWRPGEVVVDRFRLAVPRDYGAPRLAIFTGWYLGEHRLSLTDPGQALADRENRSRAFALSLEP